MAGEEYKLLKFGAIIFFAGCVVAMGAREMQKKHVPRIKTNKSVEARTKRDLIKDLHGMSATEELKELKKAEEEGPLVRRTQRAEKSREEAAEAETDNITAGDRRLLKGLVDKLSWEEEKE